MSIRYVHPRRFTSGEYGRMISAGVLPATGTELIDGVVVAGTRALRFSSSDYRRLGEMGVLGTCAPVELLDGIVAEMAPSEIGHSDCTARLACLLAATSADVRIGQPIRLRDGLEPRPDVAVYRSKAAGCDASCLAAADVLLIVEVADRSILLDRTGKMEEYALAGVPEYWVVDLRGNVVIVARNPVAGQFLDVHRYGRGESWRSAALNGAVISVASIVETVTQVTES